MVTKIKMRKYMSSIAFYIPNITTKISNCIHLKSTLSKSNNKNDKTEED